VIDRGSGPPLVLVPGIQGRWEWMRPAIAAMAVTSRVLSVSLAGEPGSGARFDAARGFEDFLAQIDALLDGAGLGSASICGVSFGGLIALQYAAARPDRVRALVLVSTPGPDWNPAIDLPAYVQHPWRLFPRFTLEAIGRSRHELAATFPARGRRATAAARYLGLVVAAPTSPARMSGRAALAGGARFREACARIACPTLIVTGEPGLDRVVPPATTLEYLHLIPGARSATLERTGHLGPITRPARFSEIVAGFVAEHGRAEPARSMDPDAVGASAP
jgi:pimeloyl-ACP methyl ester carboxylesterase